MILDLFTVTYSKDAEWFRQSSRVAQKNFFGWRSWIVVVPQKDRAIFEPIARTIKNCKIHYIPDWPGAGYFWQQWVKLQADKYSDAEFIAHVDADVFFKSTCTAADFFVGNKPAWFWSYYTDFTGPVPWKQPTERATGMQCDREFMQAFPFIIRRETYPVAREGIRKGTGRTFEQHIVESSRISNSSFSEFNAIGRIAYEHQHSKYHWVDRNRDPWPQGFRCSRQFWSHAPLVDHMPEINQMISGGANQYIRTTDRGIWVLSNDTHISRWVEQQCRLDFDVPFMSRICAFIKPGDVVVDVGAFIGDHTWAYACATRGVDSGRVLAFEPNKMPFECLRRNMAGHGHVSCINKGLGDVAGKMTVSASPNAGASHLVSGNDVDIVTLDSYKLERCNLIKIDAEGLELQILRGAELTIGKCHPVMVIEINVGALARNGVKPSDIYSWMSDKNYRIEGATNDAQFDIFCFPL